MGFLVYFDSRSPAPDVVHLVAFAAGSWHNPFRLVRFLRCQRLSRSVDGENFQKPMASAGIIGQVQRLEKTMVTIGWRLRVRMAEERITSCADLSRRLAAVGYVITSSQLTRIVDERPAQVKTTLLDALLTVLGGTLNDLMPITVE